MWLHICTSTLKQTNAATRELARMMADVYFIVDVNIAIMSAGYLCRSGSSATAAEVRTIQVVLLFG